MPFLTEHVADLVFSIVVVVLLGTGALIALAIARRQRREKFFQRIDEIRERFGPIIPALLSNRIEYQRGLDALKSISGLDRVYLLEILLLEKTPNPTQLPLLRKLCEDLGLIKLWQRQLAGKFDIRSLRDSMLRPEGFLQRVGRLHFLLRAKSAENLGIVRDHESWPLLVKALDDPHTDVQTVAARSLAAIGEPKCLPALLERLTRVILDPAYKLSLRSLKSAVVSFPLQQSVELLPLLRHKNGRIRFLAVDIIREMVEREAALEEDFALERKSIGADLNELFLTQLCFDENPDVRARSAPVLAYLADPRATPVLVTQLEDAQWFARLHATRAMAKRKFLSQADSIGKRLTDNHWMVREAAARTLLVFGRAGTDQLTEHFLNTEDRYSQEQIADEMQRAGLIPTLLTQYANEPEGREIQVFQQLAEMGKTSYLVATLVSSSDRNLRKKFLLDLGGHADSQIRTWVRQLAARETDLELRELATNLASSAAPREGA